MPFIAPTPQTAKLWGRLSRVPLVLDITSIFLVQFILVACIANALQAGYHRPHYHESSGNMLMPPMGGVGGSDEELDQVMLDTFPRLMFFTPLVAIIAICAKIILYAGRTLRPRPAFIISFFMLLGWLIHIDAWYDIGTLVKWKSESALPVLLSFVFPWRTMMLFGAAAGSLDFIYMVTAVLAVTTGRKGLVTDENLPHVNEEDLPPPYYDDEQQNSPQHQVLSARDRTRRWTAWTPNFILQSNLETLTPNPESIAQVTTTAPSRPDSPTESERGRSSTRTTSLTDVITIMSGSIITEGSRDGENFSRSLP